MSYWYLASPYSHPDAKLRELRFHAAMSATAWLIRQRKWTYSPIVHCHELASKHGLPTDAAFWGDYDLEMLSAADGMFVLLIDGWKASQGMKHEIIWAIEHEKEIIEVLPDDADDMRIPWKFGTGKYFIR